MSAEIIQIKNDSSSMPVTAQDVETFKRQRELLKEFVKSQLVEGIDNDYSIIPGTKKNSLHKPGAQKLRMLFGLGFRVNLAEKDVDRAVNYAEFTYKAEVFVLKSGAVLAECEGTANSQEVKYKQRTVWKKNSKGVKESVTEETPIFDVMNTLKKMSQKRAIVGATIEAVGASDFFSQDIDDATDAETLGVKARVEKDVQSEVSQEEAPVCHDRPMVVSKYPNRETGNLDWYCLTCKTSKPRTAS